MLELCERIKDECDRKDIPLSRVMAAANLSVSIFYKWKDGSSKPRRQSIRHIAKALGIPASTLSPELTDDVEALASATPLGDVDGEGIVDEIVFVGMRKSALNTLRPFIERANAGLIEVPADLVKGLVSLIRPASITQDDGFPILFGF